MGLVDHLVHAAAWAALGTQGPAPARATLERITRYLHLPALDIGEARRVHALLRGGTCLSRSLAVAVRLPGSRVVLGARSAHGDQARAGIQAHAWILVGEDRIGSTLGMAEIARF